jgi:hypothetical protein
MFDRYQLAFTVSFIVQVAQLSLFTEGNCSTVYFLHCFHKGNQKKSSPLV